MVILSSYYQKNVFYVAQHIISGVSYINSCSLPQDEDSPPPIPPYIGSDDSEEDTVDNHPNSLSWTKSRYLPFDNYDVYHASKTYYIGKECISSYQCSTSNFNVLFIGLN